jgi:hypothetical protein
MDYHHPEDSRSSQDSAQSDSWSQDEAGYETDATDVTDVTDGDMADLAGLLADNVHSPEYYIRQWKEFDELEYTKEDYKYWHNPPARPD